MEVDNSNTSIMRQSAVPPESNNMALLTCIRTTQIQLGKHVAKPPLLLKYLVQPPFLFFHDIITTVIRKTGFLKGLYTPDELDRIKARSLKENRIRFFDKLIRALNATTGERFPRFNIAKMSIGRHPLSVNRLLHSIAFALDLDMSSDLAVMKVNGELSYDNERGEKRKISECNIEEDDYFGDDESDNQPRNHNLNKKGIRKQKSLMIQAENDDCISMAYENDMVSLNEPLSLQGFQNKVVKPLSSLSIYDDSDKIMDII